MSDREDPDIVAKKHEAWKQSQGEAALREAENHAYAAFQGQQQISSQLPDVVNQYISVRTQRLALDKEAAAVKETEEELKKFIISKFQDQNLNVLGSTNGSVKMTKVEEPVCNDWPAYYEYIKEHGAWELLHKRVTILAVKEHYAAGEIIPGISFVDTYKLTVSGPPK